MASWRPLPGVVRSRRTLTVSLVLSSCRWYQPRGVLRALRWRVARSRSVSQIVFAVRGGCLGSGGAGWVGCRGPERPRQRMVGPSWARPGWVASWVRRKISGALVVSWRPEDGDGGRVRGAEWVGGCLGHARHGNG